MISRALLRRYPFLCCTDEESQRAEAMAADEIACESGTVLFEQGQTLESLYLLVDGSVALSYEAGDARHYQLLVRGVNAGEVFGISALIEPHYATATARVASASRIIKFKARALSTLCEVDNQLGYALMRQVAQVALERLHSVLGHTAVRVTA
jgi:CRP-like cAMP-binding protein